MFFRCLRSAIAAAICIATGVVFVVLGGRAAATPLPAVNERQLEVWWANLEKGDADASRALLKLSSHPKETVKFLAKKLRPLTIDAKRVNDLVIQLSSDKEGIWKNAFMELEYFDPRLAIDLETLMNTVTEAPARQRLVEVLSGRPAESLAGQQITLRAIGQGEGFNFASKGSWWAEHKVERINSTAWGNIRTKWTQCVRAIILLEHIGTPEAVDIMRRMAQGHPDAQPTKVAKDALQRIAGNAP